MDVGPRGAGNHWGQTGNRAVVASGRRLLDHATDGEGVEDTSNRHPPLFVLEGVDRLADLDCGRSAPHEVDLGISSP
jgi:hypothetical protein